MLLMVVQRVAYFSRTLSTSLGIMLLFAANWVLGNRALRILLTMLLLAALFSAPVNHELGQHLQSLHHMLRFTGMQEKMNLRRQPHPQCSHHLSVVFLETSLFFVL